MQEPVGRIMSKLSKMLQSNLQKDLSHLDIDRSFYPLILIEECEGLTQQELAQKLMCDKVQVVRIVDYLAEHDYVQRIINKTDRRKYELKITDKARLVIPEIKTAIKKSSDSGIAGLTESQINEFYLILKTIEKNLVNSISE